MSLRLIIYIIVYQKWFIIIPAILAPFIAGLMLTTVEPVYTSQAKVWSKEKQEESRLLQVKRFGSQGDTYADVQSNIITSNVVLEEVVNKLNLINPPPSNSIISRMFPSEIEPIQPEEKDKAITEAVKALKGSVWVEIINPEILRIDVRMNSAILATEVAREVIDAYKRQYLLLLTREVNQYETFLAEHMAQVKNDVKSAQKRLLDFESVHPELAVSKESRLTPKEISPNAAGLAKNPHSSKGALPSQQFSKQLSSSTPLVFVKDMGDVSAVPEILKRLAELKMKRNSIHFSAGTESLQLKFIDEEIKKTNEFLNEQIRDLSIQSQAAIEHESIIWDYSEARRHLIGITSEYNKILLSRGTKLKQISSIIILDPPSFDSQKVYPRKKSTLIATIFLGTLVGFALAYIAHLCDHTFHLPEEVTSATDLIVLGNSPLYDNTNTTEGIDANIDG